MSCRSCSSGKSTSWSPMSISTLLRTHGALSIFGSRLDWSQGFGWLGLDDSSFYYRSSNNHKYTNPMCLLASRVRVDRGRRSLDTQLGKLACTRRCKSGSTSLRDAHRPFAQFKKASKQLFLSGVLLAIHAARSRQYILYSSTFAVLLPSRLHHSPHLSPSTRTPSTLLALASIYTRLVSSCFCREKYQWKILTFITTTSNPLLRPITRSLN